MRKDIREFIKKEGWDFPNTQDMIPHNGDGAHQEKHAKGSIHGSRRQTLVD